ncbi:ankyrin repeat domain-containing protein [Legionella qingyii]|nr:ankyrin repeat domain-containing protein [Legionella qingyii]RUR24895.1 ankyrin repeat domain-containing protein [Legionella qingyii]RUR28831.1 ankyrin repeat domain-containing protein [Legionella qingyii]
MLSKYNFFVQSPDEITPRQDQAPFDLTNYKREPESGWRTDFVLFYAILIYHFYKVANFHKIIIINRGDNQFTVNFQKPKNPILFEKYLEEFGFSYDDLEKENMNYEISSIDLAKLRAILNILYKQKYISASLLQDINLAISSENPDLIKLNQAKEMDLNKSTIIYPSEAYRQFSFCKNLYHYCANKNMCLYKYTDLSAIIPMIERMLKNNVNPNQGGKNTKSPLMGLILNQHCNAETKQIATLLLRYNAQIDAMDFYCKTALHHAAASRKDLWIEFLLENGANATLEDDLGYTPKQIYLDSCKSNNFPIDSKIEELFEKAETAKIMMLK